MNTIDLSEGKMVEVLEKGEVYLGVELGSTRIKAVLINIVGDVIGVGESSWENTKTDDGYWTYDIDKVWQKIQDAYADLKKDIQTQYNHTLTRIKTIGISAMMHGYLAFDSKGELLVPFRTWRNANTQDAVEELSELLEFNIPHRWSIAHLHQAVIDSEEHINEVDYITTLAGYIHWKLTGEKVLGIGDASGMFPIDSDTLDYDQGKIYKYNNLIAEHNFSWSIENILPKVKIAGEAAGELTEEGAVLLDVSGELQAGVKFVPPEGDAGTGMIATNSILPKTANVSVGTSVFANIVLDNNLNEVYPEIDMVTTPVGDPVAMVHANNCSSEINSWVELFKELLDLFDVEVDYDELYSKLFNRSLDSDYNQGNIISYGLHSGENILNIAEGRPMLVRGANSNFNIANIVKANLFSAFATLRVGLDILYENEDVEIDKTLAHGGLFKTPIIAQEILANAMQTPVTVMETASEGGAWGMAVLAAYRNVQEKFKLEEYLDEVIFKDVRSTKIEPSRELMDEYDSFIDRFKKVLDLERNASDYI